MKNICLCILVALIYGQRIVHGEPVDFSELDPYIFEDQIRAVLEQLREMIPEPLTIEDTIDLELTDSLINGSIKISNTSVSGLHDFNTTSLSLTVVGLWLNLTLQFPQIHFSTHYVSDTLLATVLPIYGDGPVTIDIDNLVVAIHTQFNFTSFALKNLTLAITLNNDIHVEITNLLYSDEFSSIISNLINLLANDFIIPFVDSNTELISKIISPIVQDLINEIIANINTTTAPPPVTTVN